MNRRTVREQTFKLLFGAEFHDLAEMDEQTRFFFQEESEEHDDSEEEVQERLSSILGILPDIDKDLENAITGWGTDRIGKVELAILRLAVYEMKYDEKVPEAVAINEAVELAKKYGQDGAGSFVNGVLSKLVTNSDKK